MRKIYLVLIMVLVTGLLIGCPSDPTGNGGGTTNPEKPVEQKPHIDYPDWNNNRVDDREETLTPKDRAGLFSILDYQKKYEEKGWLAKSIDVNNVQLHASPIYNEDGWISGFSYKLFEGRDDFNQDISNWDVSNVSDISWMFLELSSFNQDISQWNTSNVIDMSYMFAEAESFNHDLSSWDVSNVTDMSFMFGVASSFNQPLAGWNTSNVTDMSWMFYGADSFNQDLGDWDVSNVTDMSDMFERAESFDQDLRSWDVTGKITTSMFYETPMEFKKDWHPKGCLCGARWDNERNTEYRDTYGEWSHDPDKPVV